MKYLYFIFTLLVIIIHIYIVYLEMVLWTTKKGIKAFGLKSKEFAEQTKVMAANQGLYNGFLAAGLFWSLIISNTEVTLFFLTCVLIAGFYGSYSTKKIRIFYIQSVPAILGILTIVLM
ncbi:DUF1304 domain-containing protein [Polaribacter sp. R77954]|uniref:DUF1304 domain-containing protein n=1 Tax=Polaribacter sp. R77954 TaxID=3093870 RepID=UPI0037C82C80